MTVLDKEKSHGPAAYSSSVWSGTPLGVEKPGQCNIHTLSGLSTNGGVRMWNMPMMCYICEHFCVERALDPFLAQCYSVQWPNCLNFLIIVPKIFPMSLKHWMQEIKWFPLIFYSMPPFKLRIRAIHEAQKLLSFTFCSIFLKPDRLSKI